MPLLRSTGLAIAALALAGLFSSGLEIRDYRPAQRLAMTFPTSTAEWRPKSPLYPPIAYQQDASAVAIFAGADTIQEICASTAKAGPHEIILGCEGEKDGAAIVALPNPCLMPHTDFYAAILCHELGHVNGWRHGD